MGGGVNWVASWWGGGVLSLCRGMFFVVCRGMLCCVSLCCVVVLWDVWLCVVVLSHFVVLWHVWSRVVVSWDALSCVGVLRDALSRVPAVLWGVLSFVVVLHPPPAMS